MTRAVIFDLDGTLIDSLPDVMNALNAVLADNARRPVTRDEAKLMVGGGAEPLLERASISQSHLLLDFFIRYTQLITFVFPFTNQSSQIF